MLFHLFEWFKKQNIKFPGSALFTFHHFPGTTGHDFGTGDHYAVWKKSDLVFEKKTGW